MVSSANAPLSFAEAERLAGEVLVAGFHGSEVPAPIAKDLEEARLGGLIFFRRNIDSDDGVQQATALQRMIRSLSWTGNRPPLLAIDQEGGRVARLRAPILPLPPMRRFGEIDDVALTEEAGRLLGQQLRAIGLTMNFAPVMDVDTNPANPVIGDRSFGRTADKVRRHGQAFARGLSAAGLLSCAKHFPGHGDTHLDSHLALPTVDQPSTRLREVELAPFKELDGIPAIMTAHVIFPAFDAQPATLSRTILQDMLRGELAYEGCIISDDLEMKAVADLHGVSQSAVLAIEAGCDMLLVCSDYDACTKARTALAQRAMGDAAFAARLADAARRSLALRRATPPTPTDLRDLHEGNADFEERLAARLRALSDIS